MKQVHRKIILILLLVSVAASTHYAVAQNANAGEVKGTVTDTTGAVIPGVQVTIRNTETGIVTHTTTDGSGVYDVPALPTGQYSVTFAKRGFNTAERSGITLHVETIAVNATLKVGVASQKVVVHAAVPLLQTESSGQSMYFNAKQVKNAPIVGGVWYNELTNELPGVNGGGGQDASGQGIGVNGTEGYSGTFLIDGSIATEPRDQNASDNYPPIDAISEVNVQTSNFGAQYGGGTANFNVILKSGTNHFHGSLFEFTQSDALNARNYFDRPPNPVAPLTWNEFGGSIGGPIIRNKLFFFFTYQDNPATSSSTYTTTVPTRGKFGTTDMEAGCFPSTVIDPNTGKPYPNNCITSGFDPVALKIQKYFPAPNLPGYVNNYTSVQTNPSRSQWYVAKLDYTPTGRQHISGSYMIYPISLVNSVDAFCSLGFDCTKGHNYNEDAQITDVWTINSHMVNDAHIGGVRELDKYIPPTYNKGYPTTLGLQPAYGSDAPGNIFPGVSITNGGGIGAISLNGGVHAKLADGSIVASDVLTLLKGRQTLKLGGQYDRSYQNYTGWGDVQSGNFVFDGVSTGVPYADFLLGKVYGWYVYEYKETGARNRSAAAFVQDNIQATPHLALNAGLRYRFQGGWSEVHNRWGTFNPNVVNTGKYAKPGTLGAMSYGGQDGRKDIQDSVNEWQPRVGLSWSPIRNWAFRASYGITYQPWAVDPYTSALGIGLNPQGSKGYGSSAAFLLKNGPGPGAVIYPKLSDLSNSQYNYQNVSYYPRHRPATYYQQALLSIQHEFPGQILVDTSYVFTKGTHLGFTRDINQVPQKDMTGSTNCYNGPTAYPLFCSIAAVLFDGYSNYNALQFRVQKRMSHGLSFVFNYAYSKTMDTGTGSGNNATAGIWQNAFNVAANYGLSTLDVKNMINGSVTYELPFGRGRMVNLRGFANQALGGWRITGVFQVHSGIPFTVTTSDKGQDLSGSGANTCGCGYAWLPNVVGNPSVSNPSPKEWFNPAAFATPKPGTFGNERRNMLIGPAWRDLDLSLGKSFRVRHGMQLEIRADSFNVLNHPNFGQPSTATGTGVVGGGVITSASGARSMQVGGRFTF